MNLFELKMLCISLIITQHYVHFRSQYNDEVSVQKSSVTENSCDLDVSPCDNCNSFDFKQ